jgi:hypothetical protein
MDSIHGSLLEGANDTVPAIVSWFRPTVRRAAWVVLALWMLGAASPAHELFEHADADQACLIAVGEPGGPRVHATPHGDAAPLAHCAVCHWMRALGGSTPTMASAIAAPAPQHLVCSSFESRPSATPVSSLASRAPPSSARA